MSDFLSLLVVYKPNICNKMSPVEKLSRNMTNTIFNNEALRVYMVMKLQEMLEKEGSTSLLYFYSTHTAFH